jgi:tetratricopeptide (TPR) repeat protein
MGASLRASVSLCMIVRDEEQNLAACLTPVAECFDDIVIVDTGSKDGTREIARRFTPRVIDFAWCDDFSAARNESLRHARGDWIFWLDADDRISERNLHTLRELLRKLDSGPRAFLMDIASSQEEAASEPSLVTHQGLFRKIPGVRWRGRVHERLDLAGEHRNWDLAHCDVQIDHEGYQDRKRRIAKLRRNIQLLLIEYGENPRPEANTLWHLGLSYFSLGDLRAAKNYLRQLMCYDLAEIGSPQWVFAVLAALALHEGQPRESLELAKDGLSATPADQRLLYAKSLALFELEELAAAEAAVSALLRSSPEPQFHFGEAGNIRCLLAPHLLGTIRLAQRDYGRAEAIFTAIHRQFPQHASTLYNLGLVYIAMSEETKFKETVAALRGVTGGNVDSRLLETRWHMKHGELVMIEPLISDLIHDAPDSACVRLVRAEWLAQRRAPVKAQFAAWRDLLSVQPGSAKARRAIASLESGNRSALMNGVLPTWSTSIDLMPGLAVG